MFKSSPTKFLFRKSWNHSWKELRPDDLILDVHFTDENTDPESLLISQLPSSNLDLGLRFPDVQARKWFSACTRAHLSKTVAGCYKWSLKLCLAWPMEHQGSSFVSFATQMDPPPSPFLCLKSTIRSSFLDLNHWVPRRILPRNRKSALDCKSLAPEMAQESMDFKSAVRTWMNGTEDRWYSEVTTKAREDNLGLVHNPGRDLKSEGLGSKHTSGGAEWVLMIDGGWRDRDFHEEHWNAGRWPIPAY